MASPPAAQRTFWDLLAEEPAVPAAAPATDAVAAALAYLARLGRPPLADPVLDRPAVRYLAGPLVAQPGGWGVPDWLNQACRTARLGLLLAGERELASEEEALAYLMTASLTAPLDHDWAHIFCWLGAQVLSRWQAGGAVTPADFWARLGPELHPELTRNQQDDLRRLRGDIRRAVLKHAAR